MEAEHRVEMPAGKAKAKAAAHPLGDAAGAGGQRAGHAGLHLGHRRSARRVHDQAQALRSSLLDRGNGNFALIGDFGAAIIVFFLEAISSEIDTIPGVVCGCAPTDNQQAEVPRHYEAGRFDNRDTMMILQAYSIVVVLFGNLQIPAAVVRVGVAVDGLCGLRYIALVQTSNDDMKNLATSLGIFYVIVLGQGTLYIVACIIQVFSFILQRFLVRGAGLRGERGVEYVDLYYSYAFKKHMEGHILSAKDISIIKFAMESLKSDGPKMHLQGLQMLDSFLKKEPFRTMTISKFTSSTDTVATLLNMLELTSEAGYRDIRLFAAKVLAELAVSLRVAPIPGAMQGIASLLHTVHRMKVKDSILYIDSQEPKQETPIQPADTDREEHHNCPPLKFWKQMAIYCLIPVEEPSKLIDGQNSSCILKFWKYITRWCSVPEEEQQVDHDFLPVLGMIILERLSSFDIENCTKISKAGLVSTIIEFTSSRIVLENINEAHHRLLKGSALKVLRRLASIEGRFGVKLRHEISEHPFLLRNLAGILDDNGSCSQQLKELAAEILRDLAMDGNTRQEIGHFQAIISRLVLEGIMDEEGTKLEVLAGLGSQICKVIPEDFAQELERGQTKEIFIKGLISSLNANMKPTACCPGVMRAIVELAVCMMECNPSYTICFNKYQMLEALLLVEQSLSRAENYRYFSDDVGLMEHTVPLSALVDRAKEMIGANNLYWGP
ncbi:hypothetical protein D1007_47046 [Hordeum vulgare]|nr:hypothetical protein D1007_47046 [Hordeum vulgare]